MLPERLFFQRSTARKIFGDENPIDKAIKIGSDTVRYTVSGVMADIPVNSHFDANIILSFMTNPRSNDPDMAEQQFQYLPSIETQYNIMSPLKRRYLNLLVKYVGPELQQYIGVSIDEFFEQGNRYRFFLAEAY